MASERKNVGFIGLGLMGQGFTKRLCSSDYAPAGYLFQCMKDLDMVNDIARDLKVPTPMASQAASLFRIMMSKGHGELDAISVLKLYDGNDVV